MSSSLDDLAARARQAAGLSHPPLATTVRPDTRGDILIVGGGQSGLAIAFALRRAGMGAVRIINSAPAGQAGVWTTTARTRTLRTPKAIPGPELGIAELSFATWYIALHGAAAYEALQLIPVRLWQDYLNWFAATAGIEVEHETRLNYVEPGQNGLLVSITTPSGDERRQFRKLVLANGIDGLGAPYLPEAIVSLPDTMRAHTADRIDFRTLVGRRVGVIGGSASAFDAAATALENGAAHVSLFSRSSRLAIAPEIANLNFTQTHRLHYRLSDAARWEIVTNLRRRGTVPLHSIQRAEAFANFRTYLGVGSSSLRLEGAEIVIDTPDGPASFDFLVAGTGYRTYLPARPELRVVAPATLLWKHCMAPTDSRDTPWSEWPYLGHGLQLLPRDPSSDGWVSRIHVYTYAAILSHGLHVGDIATAHIVVPRLVEAIVGDLFSEDISAHEEKAIAAARAFDAEFAQGPGQG